MLREDPHLSNQDLLQWSDGELSTRRSVEVRGHLASCWRCRARLSEIETSIVGFVDTYERQVAPQLPPAAGSRALLKAQMAALTSESRPRPWRPALGYA